MKKTVNVLRAILVMVVLAIAAPTVQASTTPEKAPIESNEAKIERMQKRLEEIKAIDKSTLTKEQKKALRGEVKQIKKDMKYISGGVYLSIGALILIALLLILLL